MNKEISLWQTSEWEGFQKSLGHCTTRIGSDLLVIIYPLFLGYKYGYIPRSQLKEKDFITKDLNTLAKKKKLIFIRIDPAEEVKIKNLKCRKAHSPQPESTLILNLSQDETELLKQMKRKGRYNISLAEKKGVIVKRAENSDDQELFAAIFHRLNQETTQRDRFCGHDVTYYKKMLKELPMSEIFVAFYENTPIAAAICVYQRKTAIYYYGASGNKHREVMAPYLIQWEAIKEAKKRGCELYDFLGIAPEGSPANHPWQGITEFKSKFGGNIINYPQAQDLIFRPFWYQIYKSVKFIQKLIKK